MTPYKFVRLTGGAVIDLPIDGDTIDPDASFICKGIDGLGPPEQDVSISMGKFQASVPRERQLVVRVGLAPGWSGAFNSPSTLRSYLYGLLTGGYTSGGISVIFMVDSSTEVCRTDGARISKFEINPFSKDPEVLITLDCLGPYLYALNEVHPSLVGLSKSAPSITNTGDAPTGLYMKITFTGTVDTWSIQTQGGLKKIAVRYAPDPAARFQAGDILTFDTTPYQRFIQVDRAGVISNLLSTFTSDSEFFQMYQGANVFGIPQTAFNWTDIKFRPQFWGV